MYGEGFTRHFAKICAACYKNGAIDMAVSRDETDLLRVKEDTKYPNMYGTIKNSRQDWNEWRFNLISMSKSKNEFTAVLYELKGNKSVDSIILRVCQQFYNHGAEDYIACGMPMNAASINNLTSMFELRTGGYRRLSFEKIVQKIHLFAYERLAFDKEFVENFCGGDREVGRKSHALTKASYDKFSRMIWLTTNKKEWYDY